MHECDRIPRIASHLATPCSPSASPYPPSSSCYANTEGLQLAERIDPPPGMATRLEQQTVPAASKEWIGSVSERREEIELEITEGHDRDNGVCDPAREHVGRYVHLL